MADRRIDPVTEDYVDAAKGGFEQCEDIETQVAYSYKIALGEWEGDPLFGHRLNELAKALDTAENRNRLRDLARAALDWLVALGKIERVDAMVESWGAGRVAFLVEYYTPGSKRPKKAGPFLVPVGAG